MNKYDLLWEYIKINAPSELSFDEVRRICGFPIDHSFLNCKKELEAYRALGCSFAEEINEELAVAEPFDVQMEYRL